MMTQKTWCCTLCMFELFQTTIVGWYPLKAIPPKAPDPNQMNTLNNF